MSDKRKEVAEYVDLSYKQNDIDSKYEREDSHEELNFDDA